MNWVVLGYVAGAIASAYYMNKVGFKTTETIVLASLWFITMPFILGAFLMLDVFLDMPNILSGKPKK